MFFNLRIELASLYTYQGWAGRGLEVSYVHTGTGVSL